MRLLRTVTFSGLLSMMLPAAAFAADPVYDETVSAFNWTGLYVGVSGGYLDPNLDIGFGATSLGYGNSGYLIGGTVGYNMQMGNFVYGVEGDLSYADVGGDFGDLFGFGFNGKSEGDYFATIRGRLGYSMDRVLLFGTAGIAFANLDVETPAGNFSDDMVGYTVGGGLEYGITQHLTTKIEYLYSDFGKETTTLFPGDIQTEADMNIVRVGLNYKF